jgi:hypothetical protein
VLRLTTIFKGISIILFSFAGMTFYESCCGIPDFPYYEIESMDASVRNTALAAQDTLKIQLVNQRFNYLAHSYSTFTSAYAWSCESDGYLGPKYKYTELKITCEQDFDDAHPAGASLNELFYLTSEYKEKLLLSSYMNQDSILQQVAHGYFQLETTSKPASNSDVEFLIQFTNAKNNRVTVKTPRINWN